MGISPHQVTSNANSKMLLIEAIVADRATSTPTRMVRIARLVDEYRAAVKGSTTDPFRDVCVCSGASMYTSEQNANRRPYVLNAECRVHREGIAS